MANKAKTNHQKKQRSPIFEKTFNDYVAQVARCDWTVLPGPLGIELTENRLVIPVFNRRFYVSKDDIADDQGRRPRFSICVLLCRYILQCPEYPPAPGSLVTYKDFKDAAPFVGAFRNRVEKSIAAIFTRRAGALERCCGELGGRPFETDVSSDLAISLPALPRVPVCLMFNDADDEFSAECTILFRQSAQQYLDMECLAMAGDLLATWLEKEAGGRPLDY